KESSRCEPPHVLQEERLEGAGATASPTLGTVADGSADCGIFRLSSHLWCTGNHRPSDNCCRMACRDLLLGNISEDIICVKKIVRNPQGLNLSEVLRHFVQEQWHYLLKPEHVPS
uniref:Glycosyl hydrolases family 22 (GH22) domain-containing protein n=1 Tax=Corvus moneduloides TaxID=1196302 RepID=A0A8U7N5N3_CORMO